MTRTHFWIIALLMAVVIPGCKDRSLPAGGASRTSDNSPLQSTAATSNATDKWLGRWVGPEGTYLVLSKNADKYAVLINSLDGPATFEGTSTGERIEFRRNGKTSPSMPGTAMTRG